MDPVSAVIVGSTILNLLGEGARAIVDEIKYAKNVSQDKLNQTIQKAISYAQNHAQNKLDKLINSLSNLDIIKKSPIVSETLDKYRQKLQSKVTDLRNDIVEIGLLDAERANAYAEAQDASIFQKGKLDKQFKKKGEDINVKIQEIEKRI